MEKKSDQGITDLVQPWCTNNLVGLDCVFFLTPAGRGTKYADALRQLYFIFWMWRPTFGCEIDYVQANDLNLVDDAYLDQSA